GPTGATGDTGPTGATGATGPAAVAPAGLADFTQIYATTSQTVPNGGGVVWDTQTNSAPGSTITVSLGSLVTFGSTGFYLITFGYQVLPGATGTNAAGKFQLVQNLFSLPVLLPNTVLSFATNGGVTTTFMDTLAVIVNITNAGDTLSLVNTGTTGVTLQAAAVGGLVAFMTIAKVQ